MNLIHDCPACNGTGVDDNYADNKCDWCDGKGRLSENELWNYYDVGSEKRDAEALAWAESQEGSGTWNIDS